MNTADKQPINRWRWLVRYLMRAQTRISSLERRIVTAACDHIESIEGARVALACVEWTVDQEYAALVDERFATDHAAGHPPYLVPVRAPGPQWRAAVLQIATSRGGLDGMILAAGAEHVATEEGFRVALGALRIPVDEGWVEHLRAASR